MEFSTIVFYHFLFFFVSAYADPCTTHATIQNEEKRSAGYKFEMSSDNMINDVLLTNDWYRIISSIGDDMPTDPPDPFKCGTWYPIWLNDALPEVGDGIVSKTVCMRSLKKTCENSWNIEIKNCGSFYVYNLVSSGIEKTAYCFGSLPVPCPYAHSSETGFYPDCTTDFPGKNVSGVEVLVDLVPGLEIYEDLELGPSLVIAFMCKFNEVLRDGGGEFVYDVHWYINEESVVLHTGILFSNIGNTNLTESDWIGNYTLNMVVRCSVRLRYDVELTPGHEVKSASFQAGLYPERYEYTVKENEEIEIKLHSTMPVGCISQIRDGCFYELRLVQPKYQKECYLNNCNVCNGNVQPGDLSFEKDKCSYRIEASTWDQPLILKVTGYVNGQYDYADRTAYLKVESPDSDFYAGAGLFAWDNASIPAIKIIVTDDEHQMAGRVCESVNDPHFYTADRYRWDNYKPGEYILYRHKTKPYQVNAMYGICNHGYASCNCGIAIRSGHSMFVMRTCDVITLYETHTHPPIIEMRSCDDSSMIIKENGGTYTVTLPIGTEIKFSTSTGWGHEQYIGYIHVKPSLLDVENSEGLCGNVSGGSMDTSDDFTLRNGTVIATTYANWKTFAENWRVNDTETFFADQPLALSQEINLQQYCICETNVDEGETINDFSYKCGLEGPLKSCLLQTADAAIFHTTCSSSREKRGVGLHHIITKSLTDSDDIIDNREMYIASESELSAFETKHIDEWPMGWTETKAREVCQSGITGSTPEDILESSHTTPDGYIEQCIFDIKLAGDTRFLEVTISSLQEVAISEISRNVSLFIKDNATGTASSAKKSIGELLLGNLCKNNCSNNGVCQNGVCTCNHGFGKQDCSEDLALPPRNITIPMNGICNTRERLCAKTNIQGVFNSRNITCRSRHLEILKDGNWIYRSDYQTYAGQYRNSYLVSCELPTARRKKRSISESVIADGFEISLSTDGNNFGDNVKIMIYDLECFSCFIENNTCVELDTCPIESTTEAITEPLAEMSPPNSPIESTSTSASSTSSTSITSTSGSSTSSMSTTSTIKTSSASEPKTETSSTSTPKNENTDSNNIVAIIGGCIGFVVILIFVLSGMIYYKMKAKQNGHIKDNLGLQFQVPPKQTATKSHFSDKYQREQSNNSMGNVFLHLETDNISRPRTPMELFSVGNN